MAEAQTAQIEYTIYTFDVPVAKKKGDISWKKHATITDMTQAMTEAQNLIGTDKFQKIEVKKKFFDPKQNRPIDMTVKVLHARRKKGFFLPLAAVCAALCGGGMFAAARIIGAGLP